jgi:hypothetical protein
VGKSSLAHRLLEADGIPWLPTDVVRTVVRRVVAEIDAVDSDPVDAERLAQVMYRHVEQAAEVCAEEADRFLIEGFELAPWYPLYDLRAAVDPPRVDRAGGMSAAPAKHVENARRDGPRLAARVRTSR